MFPLCSSHLHRHAHPRTTNKDIGRQFPFHTAYIFMLFFYSDFKSGYCTTCKIYSWIAILLGFHSKCSHVQAPVKWNIPACYPWFKCYQCMCAWSYGILPWLEPCVFPDVTISRRVFTQKTHGLRGPNRVHSTLISVLLLYLCQEAAAAAGEWSRRAPHYWSGCCEGRREEGWR